MAFKEKRREERYSANLKCSIEDDIFDVIDVSLHGVGILSDKVYAEDRPLHIVITAGDNTTIPLNVIVRNSIIWDGSYRYGTEVTDISDEWMSLIYTYKKNNR